MPVGAYLLPNLMPQVFKAAVGLIVLAVGLALLAGWRLNVRFGWLSALPIGMLSGLMCGSTSLSGPPVILLFANQGDQKNRFRGNLVAYFALLNLATIPVYWSFELINRQVVLTAAVYLLPLVLGSLAGVWVAQQFNERIFRRVALLVIVALGIVLVATNLRFG